MVGLTVENAPVGITLPYQLVVGTSGSEAGVPTYGKPGSITTTAPPSASTPSGSQTPHYSDGSSAKTSPRTTVALGFLGTLLLIGGVGGWLLLRRRHGGTR